MLTKDKALLIGCWLLALFCCVSFAVAQERTTPAKPPNSTTALEPAEDIVRVNTRAVFIDALVKDKKNNVPVTNLTRENFMVPDDGRVRELTYFNTTTGTRRTRLLMLVLDFFGGNGRAFHDKETVARLASVLAKLPPEDELAVAAAWIGKDTSPCSPLEPASPNFPPLTVVQDFTRDREKIIASLEVIPALVAKYNQKIDELANAAETYANAASSIPCAVDALRQAATSRPNSQAVMVIASDDFVYFPFTERDRMIHAALQTGITVNLLRIRTSFLSGMMASIAKKAAGYRQLPGTVDVVADAAQQTGGETVRVGGVKKYIKAFEKLIIDLTARYTLGFTLDENEQNTNRLHKLEVRIKAQNERSKERKVAVSARNGYYLPKE